MPGILSSAKDLQLLLESTFTNKSFAALRVTGSNICIPSRDKAGGCYNRESEACYTAEVQVHILPLDSQSSTLYFSLGPLCKWDFFGLP